MLFANSERLIKQQADRLAEDGYRDAGYKYVSIDVSLLNLKMLCAMQYQVVTTNILLYGGTASDTTSLMYGIIMGGRSGWECQF